MKKKQILSALCAIAIAASFIGGCGGKNTSSAGSSSTAEAVASNTTTAQSDTTTAAVSGDATKPAATEPAATEPVATEPAATEPAATEPAATEPAATEPAATEPAATEPAATEPAATEPAATEPAATEPATEPNPGYQAVNKLSNPNADEITCKVYDYICENFGKKIMTCQQESPWMGSPDYEMNHIEKTTGKLPAIRGLDYMNNDFSGVNRRAIAWWKKGGIVTICWHTGVKSSGYQESLNDTPDFNKLLTEGTAEYNEMMESWDKAAKALTELRDAGVPVLWRPFHEFDGQWFWWGKGGKENFIKLWQLMYDKFTNEYGLTNLIWVLGYSGDVKNGWYVGDGYCDIIGSDTYDNSTNSKAWKRLNALGTGKPMTFHECGNVPSIDNFVKDGCIWSWFMIWHTDYIINNNADNLKNVYNSDMAITLDKLPEFK